VELQLLQLRLVRLYLPLPLLLVSHRHRHRLRHLPSLLSVPHLDFFEQLRGGELTRQRCREKRKNGGLGEGFRPCICGPDPGAHGRHKGSEIENLLQGFV